MIWQVEAQPTLVNLSALQKLIGNYNKRDLGAVRDPIGVLTQMLLAWPSALPVSN